MIGFSAWFFRRDRVTQLTERDHADLLALFEREYSSSCFASGWLARHGVVSKRGRPLYEFVGFHDDDEQLLSAALVVGQNLVVLVGHHGMERIGEHCSRRVSSLRTVVGVEQATVAFLRGASVEPDKILLRQPQLCLAADAQTLRVGPENAESSETSSALDDLVDRMRPARRSDSALALRATLTMYEEETGLALSPAEVGAFRLSVDQKIREQRLWLLVDGQTFIFKAGIGLPAPRQAHLEGVYTVPEFRRRGIAREAMNRLCEKLALRYDRITLTANRKNTAAINLYESMGFHRASDYLTVFVRD